MKVSVQVNLLCFHFLAQALLFCFSFLALCVQLANSFHLPLHQAISFISLCALLLSLFTSFFMGYSFCHSLSLSLSLSHSLTHSLQSTCAFICNATCFGSFICPQPGLTSAIHSLIHFLYMKSSIIAQQMSAKMAGCSFI